MYDSKTAVRCKGDRRVQGGGGLSLEPIPVWSGDGKADR